MLKGRDQTFFGETEELQHISTRVNVENIYKQTLQPGMKSDKDDKNPPADQNVSKCSHTESCEQQSTVALTGSKPELAKEY